MSPSLPGQEWFWNLPSCLILAALLFPYWASLVIAGGAYFFLIRPRIPK